MSRAKDIKLETIIRRKIEFIKTSEMYSDEEMINYKSGELKAYDMIMLEINRQDEKNFEEKLFNVFKDIQIYFEQENKEKLSQNELEELVGYNNTIVYVLSLLNPIYEFKMCSDNMDLDC